MWRVSRVGSTGSTNADVAERARAGEPEDYVLVADQQTAGRGRLGRPWESPAGASLAVTVLLRPATVPASQWAWLPLLVGVAAVEAVQDVGGGDAVLKWPNDVLLDGAKLAGILVERVETPSGPAAVAGVGVNISAAPVGAASLAGSGVSRDDVLEALLARLGAWYERWRRRPDEETVALATAYRQVCDTLGRHVRAELPGGDTITGRAIDIDESGRLVIDTADGSARVGAGDVVHLRAASA